MFFVYLLLGGPYEMVRDGVVIKDDMFVKGIVTPDCCIFSIYDFMQIVLGRDRDYVKKKWKTMCKRNSQFMYVEGVLGLEVPSSKTRKITAKQGASPGTTVAGLRAVLDVMGINQVSDANRKTLEDIFTRYATGERSMIVEVDLTAKEHKIPRFSYNFQPPSISHEPVASMIIEDARAGALEPDASEEGSIEWDFSSNEDHMVKSNKKRKKNICAVGH